MLGPLRNSIPIGMHISREKLQVSCGVPVGPGKEAAEEVSLACPRLASAEACRPDNHGLFGK